MLNRSWWASALVAISAVPSQAQTSVDLSTEARTFVTHHARIKDSAVSHLTDGKPETHWHGESQDLTVEPTNILILFREPQTIGQVALTSQVFKNLLRLKRFEIYARVGKEWAGATPLAVVKDFNKGEAENLDMLTRVCQFEPVRTDGLRIRLRDTERPDHAYPRICEIQVWRADMPGRQLEAAPVPDESKYERLLCEWAMGLKHQYPGTTFDPEKGYLHYARTFVDTMLAKGTDIYGEAHSPMFVSILTLPTQKHPGHLLPGISGQRRADRAPFGGNLHHDVMLLQAMDVMTKVTGDGKYSGAVDAYLKYFLANCPAKETGIFPWGEHAHWDFHKDEPGHLTHELLGGIPISFWERLWQLSPDAVTRMADGLINHVVDLDTFTWNRHANIRKPLPVPRPKGLGINDFPRHGGFYILLWTFVHSKTKDPKHLDWASRAIEHGWRLKRAPLNLPPFTIKSSNVAMESAFSKAASILEAAALLPDGEAKAQYETVANTYLDSVAKMPHKPREGHFVTSCKIDAPPSEATGKTVPWSARYGGKFTADDAVLCLAAYRLTKKPDYLRMAEEAAEFYATHEPPPADEIVRAHVYAAVISLFIDLHDLTHAPKYLEQAKRYAKLSIERLYWNGLFRGATGINHYESQMMVGNLVYALVWLHAVDKGLAVKVEPNYFDR